ncbi:hypothetical protein MY10362_009631, partial [Beauveria mimosiformis]
MALKSPSNFITGIQFHLQRAETDKRAPSGLDEALKDVCLAQHTPEKQLIEHSLPGWVALVSDKESRTAFNQLSPGDVDTVLRGVEKLKPSDGFMKDVRHMFSEAGRHVQRQECLKNAGLGQLLEFDGARPSKRKCLGSGKEAPDMPVPSTAAVSGQGQVPPADESVISNTAQVSPPLDAVGMPETTALFAWSGLDFPLEPTAQRLPRLFCPKLCQAIVKIDGYARASMDRGEESGEVLRMEIHRQFIPALAFNLFGVIIEDMQKRYWKLEWENGTEANVKGPA